MSSKSEPHWKELRSPESGTLLWYNEEMRFCDHKPCNFATVDPDDLRSHVLSVHGEEVLKAQGKLEGGVVTDDDKRAAIMAAIPDERYQCPFCLTVFPHSRVTRFFLDDGKLSKMALCNKEAGGCGKRMQCDSMRKTRLPPRDFGRFIGSYPKFWAFVDHDTWVKGLKKMLPSSNTLKWDDPTQPMSQFWLGYGDARPEWALKQAQDRMYREYEESQGGFKGERGDQEDELGK